MVEKSCDEFSKVGDVINYGATITNIGDTDLEIISVVDTVADANQKCVGQVLAASGGTCSFSYPYTVQQGTRTP